MIARRGNKQLSIDDASVNKFVTLGYDIYRESGDGPLTLVKHGHGKTIPIEAAERLEARIAELERENAALAAENGALRKQIDEKPKKGSA